MNPSTVISSATWPLAAVCIVALIVAGVVVCRRFGGFEFAFGFKFKILPRIGKNERNIQP